ncbi:MAG TPA: hypothetical protein VGA78_10050 [Gemmatimonadales bacterium]
MLFAAVTFLGCRGEPPRAASEFDLAHLVDSLRPAVEAAVGLKFQETPRSALVSRDDVRRYILARLDKEFPHSRREGVQSAYRLFGLLPDTLDLEALLVELYTEQVAGYYDPETRTLYGVAGSTGVSQNLVLAHELVHALQHQYLPLDSLMQAKGDGDRVAATQAVLEGHATLASIAMVAPGSDVVASDEFWESYRDQVRVGQQSMPVFARAPLVLREALIFPYVGGAEFMRWWKTTRRTPLPLRTELPLSTEQVLHPGRYPADGPVALRFADSSAEVLFEETLGELETDILLATFRGAAQVGYEVPLGWGGDRYRVIRSPDGPALVWYSVWDSEAQRARFLRSAAEGFRGIQRAGYRVEAAAVSAGGRPGIRIVHAPAAWAGWARLPALAR